MSKRRRKKNRRERITEGLEINRKGEYRTLPLTPDMDMDVEPKTLPLDPNTEIKLEKMRGGGIAIKGTGFKGVR